MIWNWNWFSDKHYSSIGKRQWENEIKNRRTTYYEETLSDGTSTRCVCTSQKMNNHILQLRYQSDWIKWVWAKIIWTVNTSIQIIIAIEDNDIAIEDDQELKYSIDTEKYINDIYSVRWLLEYKIKRTEKCKWWRVFNGCFWVKSIGSMKVTDEQYKIRKFGLNMNDDQIIILGLYLDQMNSNIEIWFWLYVILI